MARFRKKPVVIDAVLWTGENVDEVKRFLADHSVYGQIAPGLPMVVWNPEERQQIDVPLGWWLVRDGRGFSASSPPVFEATYEPVE